jgi:hypothetical protein
MGEIQSPCVCASTYKSLRWESEKVSERFSAEYQYCDCSGCNKSVYTGIFRMIDTLNQNKNLSAKEQNMAKDKMSVSKTLKALHAKEGKGLSLKEFARRLERAGNELAKDWFANKSGIANDARDKKSIDRIAAEKAATKSAKKSKTGPGAKK